MAEQTGIEWCDATFNPWWGCEKVSPGCAHCYADTLSKRYAKGVQLWGAGHRFRFFGDKHWAEPLKWARLLPAKLGRRPRVFCASMADVFEDRVELMEHRIRLFELIDLTPELDWLILTKRPENARDWIDAYEPNVPIPNVWMGVSIENARHTWRADVLREIPAAVRFLSCEPLLGSLYDTKGSGEDGHSSSDATLGGGDDAVRRTAMHEEARSSDRPDVASLAAPPIRVLRDSHGRAPLDLTGIDWVIVGGESGHGARPMDVQWVREIVSACKKHADRPAPFVKQLGARPIVTYDINGHTCSASLFGIRDRKGGDWTEWPAELRVREFPQTAAVLA